MAELSLQKVLRSIKPCLSGASGCVETRGAGKQANGATTRRVLGFVDAPALFQLPCAGADPPVHLVVHRFCAGNGSGEGGLPSKGRLTAELDPHARAKGADAR